jgi:hypothetical protein
LKALFKAPPGYYRILVFLVTPVSFSENRAVVTEEEAQKWLEAGFNTLPDSIGSRPFADSAQVPALIYQFQSAGTEALADTKVLHPSPLDARTHLVNSGVWPVLEGK